MYIGLISDTHGSFCEELRHFLEPVDEIWHAGDWGGDLGFASAISGMKPLVGVHGNCDGQSLRFDYPEYQVFEREGLKVLMMHIGGYPGRYDVRARQLIEKHNPGLFICGHSHILKVMYDERLHMMTMNPGACGDYGWHKVKTALRFKIEEGQLKDCELLKLPRRSIEINY